MAWAVLVRAESTHDPHGVEVARRAARGILAAEIDEAMARVGLTGVMDALADVDDRS